MVRDVEAECPNVGSAHNGIVTLLHLLTTSRFVTSCDLRFPLRRPLAFVQMRGRLVSATMAEAVVECGFAAATWRFDKPIALARRLRSLRLRSFLRCDLVGDLGAIKRRLRVIRPPPFFTSEPILRRDTGRRRRFGSCDLRAKLGHEAYCAGLFSWRGSVCLARERPGDGAAWRCHAIASVRPTRYNAAYEVQPAMGNGGRVRLMPLAIRLFRILNDTLLVVAIGGVIVINIWKPAPQWFRWGWTALVGLLAATILTYTIIRYHAWQIMNATERGLVGFMVALLVLSLVPRFNRGKPRWAQPVAFSLMGAIVVFNLVRVLLLRH